MTKKFKIYLSILLCMILCLPAVSVKADGSGFFKAITSEIFVDTYGAEAASWVSPQFSRSESYFDNYHYIQFNDVSSLAVSPFDPKVIYVLGGFNSAAGNTQLTLIDLNDIDDTFSAVFTSSGITIKLDHPLEVQSKTVPVYLYRFDNYNTFSWILDQTGSATFYNETDQSLLIDSNYNESNNKLPIKLVDADQNASNTIHGYCRVSSSYMTYMYYTNCKSYYSINELWSKYYSPINDGNITNNFGKAMLNGSGVGLTDYLAGGFSSYFDGENVITPEGPVTEESDENHMYFQNCNIGFAEPVNVNSFDQFGGAYAYFDYDVDQWINDHIDNYYLSISAELSLDGTTRSGGAIVRLDPDGCTCLPLSDFFGNSVSSAGVITYTTSEIIEQNFLKTYLYSMNPTSLEKFVEKNDNSSGSTILSDLLNLYNIGRSVGEKIGNVLMTFVGAGKTVIIPKDYDKTTDDLDVVAHNDFKITLSCKLTTNNNLESGSFGKMFDLYKFYDVVTDSSGLSNENPYDNDDDDDNYVPSLPGEGDTVIIPSGTGSGNVSVYNMTPSQIKLVLDTGFEKFVNWFNNHGEGEIASNYFWGTLTGNFEDNPATELYSDYFGFLPADLKTLIFGVLGISFVGTGFCILRKNLRG